MKILDVLQLFLSNKAVASIFHEIDGYHPDGLKAHQFETKTLLGPFLRISPLLISIAAFNYTDGITKSQIRSIDESLQAEHNMSVNRLFSLCDKLVRAGGAAREAFLKLLADIVNKNHLRRGSHADPRKNASDSFMINLSLILVKFAQPFLATLNPKMLEKIDIHYLSQRNKLLDLTEETKINSTIQEYDENYTDDKLTDKPLNFISDCFYLLLAYIHYGIGGIYISADRVKSGVKQLTEQLKKVEDMLQKAGSQAQTNPLMKMMIETKVNPLKKELHNLKAMKCAIEMFATNRNTQLEVFDIIIGSVTFFMKLVDPTHKYPSAPLQIPLRNMDDDVDKLDDIEYLRSISPVPFKYYPEMFIEGIVNYCHYISRYNNNPMFQNEEKLNKFVEFSITILRCPELVSNPHLKARLTEVLFFGSLPLQNGRDGYMMDIFNNNTKVKKNLMISLLDFYVMVEKTGASSQFYDKFNTRYHISFILEQLWKFDFFKDDLKRIAQKLQTFFVRLIARMLNDTTYLLDESLNHLHIIGSCQREIASRANGNPPSNDDSDEDLQAKLADSERIAKSFVQLTNKTILLFNLFTEETPRSFTIVEIVDRLAGMLNYNLVALVGPKYNELKVKDPEAYQFKPSELLFQLSSIFINLSNEQPFVDAVARDQRSFDPECFKRAIKILYKVGKVPGPEFETKLIGFVERAEQVQKEDEEEEMELGDIPDDFLDPLMYTLMKDPVKLPHSKISMDRSVLKAHLMNDPTDPFNRTPLKLEDVDDDVELKEKIQAFIKERKAALKQDKDGDVVMK
ncbi:unnamed protein product [Ambrosiozyma monospora]|uniref:Unnamed protein product n=1 Tax=Ambrosiozyma monospora TaxID=43982 RepID=A0ACB5STG4_AMBMO|nr:unnamed protein product [Ambrosiozyma monospora]